MDFWNQVRLGILVSILAAGLLPLPAAGAQQLASSAISTGNPSLTVNQIVSRMEARNRDRAAALHEFQGIRVYRMDYNGFFGHHEAEMTVDVDASKDNKQFKVVSQTGSKFIIDHVLKKLLEGEKEATSDVNRRRTALDTDNYNFSLAGLESSPSGSRYILNVIPKTNNKFLYRGKIWVDTNDFAVCRIAAEPAKSPSFWIKKSEIHHKYSKVGDFWLPEENHTESWIRLGGHALLTIEYKNYKITDASPLNAAKDVSESPQPGPSL